MPARFPLRRGDGSFTVSLVLLADRTLVRSEVEDWLSKWLERQETGVPWLEYDSEGNSVSQPLFLREAFSLDPAVASVDGHEVVFRFEGRPDARHWRDWLAFLGRDFGEEVAPAQPVAVRNG